MGQPGKVGLALPAASALRDRADRASEQAVGRRARPRRRFLHTQRSRYAARLLPSLGLVAALTGMLAILDLGGYGAGSPRPAILSFALAAVVVSGCALGAVIARKSYPALLAITLVSAFATLLGWSLAVRASGGTASPHIMVIPMLLIGFVAFLPLPAVLAAVIGVFAYGALLLAAPGVSLAGHVLILALAGAGFYVARLRHKASLATFLRIERLSAAVSRMRRVQEQLVVVEKLEALRVLVGGMAHELNNALAVSVASNQQALKEAERVSPNAAAALRRSEGGLTRIRRTVDRLRRFAMAAEGTLEPADVGAMLDFALESAIGRARSGVIIERVYDPGVGPIECHVAALAEALFQIARNAVEAMPGGGTIQAIVRNEGDRVVLAVADEGRGIPPSELAKVFDPFYSRGQGKSGRSGMGLSAVYGLVSALGGSVEIHSAVGKGTEVAIRMPRKKSGTGSVSGIPPAPSSIPPPMTPPRF
jgi:signal transduction histidine kinase